ncbi:hypothetical protein [Curtobacterium sp. VKM Ac-1376]|uniref:hypothetical protein n=1 Tax=Curtobacterium sp. VKM Ac-1376 TaxID=123312 RepID=UPI00188B6532|nr:hypothetical protein [Curtobacterium sp. VKM Ac-1376]MBF4613737.1 hypothetical protein [Curtobacterium sp. VKM Ac-1376]
MATTQDAALQMRRKSAEFWEASSTALLSGEWGYDETNRVVKIGDGYSLWSDLPVFMTATATGDLPAQIREQLAANLGDPSTPEGAAVADSAAGIPFNAATGLYTPASGRPIPSLDEGSNQLPDAVRTTLAANLANPAAPEGAAVAGAASALPTVPVSAGSRAKLITYGHSFLAEQGLTDASHYWARRLATALGLTYPTSDGGAANDLKRAVGGTTIDNALGRVAGGALPWVPGTKALVVLETLINSARLNGATAIDITSATNNARSMMAILGASEIIEDTDPRIVKSATTWQRGTGAFLGGSAVFSSAAGSYFEYTVPADRDVFIATIGRGAGTAGAIVDITDQTSGAALATGLDLSNTSITSAVVYVYRTPASTRGHTVRFTKTGGTSLYIDAVLPVSPTPPPVLWMKEPHLLNYAASTSFPNGSDAVLDAFNAIVDQMAAEFPNLIVADPNQLGYWDKNTDILTSDQVHPNDKGHLDLARAGHDAVRAWQARKALSLI